MTESDQITQLKEKLKKKNARINFLNEELIRTKLLAETRLEKTKEKREEVFNLNKTLEEMKKDSPIKCFKIQYEANCAKGNFIHMVTFNEIKTGYFAADIVREMEAKNYSKFSLISIERIPE